MARAILLLTTLLLAGCWGKPATRETVPSPPTVVTLSAIPDVLLDGTGATNVTVSITVADGYHVQANPASEEFLIPLELQLDPVEGLSFGSPEYPAAVRYRLENTDEDLLTYEGTFRVNVQISASKSGAFEVDGRVRYQACDAKRCLFPSSVPFTVRIVVK